MELSGEDGKNYKKIKKIIKKKHNKEYIDIIKKNINTYRTLVWTRLAPLLNEGVYKETNKGFINFVLYLLSKGENNMNKLLDKSSENILQNNLFKYNIEYIIQEKLFNKYSSSNQLIQVYKTNYHGNLLVIDHIIKFSEKNEVNYNEMIVHPTMNYIVKDNIHVLILGGGSGGPAREVLRHPNVQHITQLESDETLISVSKKFFNKSMGYVYDHPKLELIISDINRWLTEHNNMFDVIIIDSSDLDLTREFFENIKKRMNKYSILIFNVNTIYWSDQDLIKIMIFQLTIFKYCFPLTTTIPSIAGGSYLYILCSDEIEPLNMNINWIHWKSKNINTEYYSKDIHKASMTFSKKLNINFT
jgi:spermidine synthase